MVEVLQQKGARGSGVTRVVGFVVLQQVRILWRERPWSLKFSSRAGLKVVEFVQVTTSAPTPAPHKGFPTLVTLPSSTAFGAYPFGWFLLRAWWMSSRILDTEFFVVRA